MAISINKLAISTDKKLFYDQTFRRHLEAYMEWFRQHPETTVIPVDPHDAYKYEGDLYGLLSVNGIPIEYHWLVMRVNDIFRAGDVSESLTILKIPEFGVVNRILQLYKTQNKKNMT